jgi:hypothetical protein
VRISPVRTSKEALTNLAYQILGNGTRTVEEGAQTPVLLAIHDIQNKTGSFWQYEKEIDWVG